MGEQQVWLLTAGEISRVEAYADKRSVRAAIMRLYPGGQIIDWADGSGLTTRLTPEEEHEGGWAEAWLADVHGEEVSDAQIADTAFEAGWPGDVRPLVEVEGCQRHSSQGAWARAYMEDPDSRFEEQ